MCNSNTHFPRNRIAVITRQPDSYSVKRFCECTARFGNELILLDPHQVYVDLLDAKPAAFNIELSLDPQRLAIVPRLGSTATEYSLVVLDMLERAGAASVNCCASILKLRNKFTALAQLAAAGVPVPDSAMLRTPSEIAPAVERLGGYPLVLKFIRGSQGVGVILAPDESVVTSVLEAMNLLQYDVLLQRYYPNAAMTDTRVFCLGDTAQWAVRRESTSGRFRSNFHRGGQACAITLEPELSKLALAATQVFGLGMAGVDLIEGPNGPLVMEVNSSPGFETIERCYPVDIAGTIVEYALSL